MKKKSAQKRLAENLRLNLLFKDPFLTKSIHTAKQISHHPSISFCDKTALWLIIRPVSCPDVSENLSPHKKYLYGLAHKSSFTANPSHCLSVFWFVAPNLKIHFLIFSLYLFPCQFLCLFLNEKYKDYKNF